MEVRDALLSKSKALPNGTNSATSDPIDTGKSTQQGDPGIAPSEFLLSAPLLTTAQLPDATTMQYDIVHSANANLSGGSNYITAAIKQTGAGGVGAAAVDYRFRLPSTIARYVGVVATGGQTNVAASGASLTLQALL